MDKTTVLILAILALFIYRGSQENEESWEVQRDDSGKLVGITVHRKVKPV